MATKFASSLSLAVLLASTALAAEAPTYHLTYDQVGALSGGLGALGAGYQDVADGKPVARQYKLAVETRVAVAEDQRQVQLVVGAIAQAREQIISEISGNIGIIKPGTPQAVEFNRRVRALARQTIDLELLPLDVDLAANPSLPPNVVAALAPLLKGLPTLAPPTLPGVTTGAWKTTTNPRPDTRNAETH